MNSIENRVRRGIERVIVSSAVKELLAQEYVLSVFDGGEEYKRSTDHDIIMRDLMNTDDDYLFVWESAEAPRSARFGWVRFVYGNEGWYVISDYTTNLETKLTKTMRIVERYEEKFS